MSVFDDVFGKVLASFSGWIQVRDPKSSWTIENFEKVNYDEKIIKPHCIDCVIVNQCWFKDEENKRPVEFDYSQYPEIPLFERGLYHPKCHDQKIPILAPKPSDIKIFDLEKKKDYVINNKENWLKSMGYNKSDIDEFIQLIKSLSKEAYCSGNYVNNPPKDEKKKKYGFRIRVILDFPGKREKLGKIYKITSSYIVYPNGRLKNNTPIGGWAK